MGNKRRSWEAGERAMYCKISNEKIIAKETKQNVTERAIERMSNIISIQNTERAIDGSIRISLVIDLQNR